MKKIFSMLLVLVAATIILAGCKTTKPSTTNNTTAPNTGTTTGGGTTTTTTNPGQTFNCPTLTNKTVKVITHVEDGPEFQHVKAGFENACGVTVISEHVSWENQITKLRNTVAAQDTYDVALLFGEFYPTHITSQLLMPLDGISTFDPNDPAWDQDILNTFKWKGKYYGAGSVYDKGPRLMFYNKDILEEEGLDDPIELEENGEWTWDAYKEMLQQTTIKNEDGSVVRYGGMLGGWYHMLMQANGGDLIRINTDGTTSFNMRDPKAVAAWQFEWDLTFVDKLLPVDGDVKAKFENKEVVFGWEGAWYINSLYENENIDFEWDFVNFPQGPDVPDGEIYVPGEYSSYGIPNGAKNPEGGVLWIKYYSDPNNHLFPDQVKGTLYTTEEQTERFEMYRENVRRTNFHGIVVDSIWDFYWKALKEGVDTLDTALTSFEPTFRNLYNFAVNPPQPEPAKPVTPVNLDFEGLAAGTLPAGWGAGWNSTFEYVNDARAIDGTSLLVDFTGDWGGVLQSDASVVKLPGWYEYTISFDYKVLSAFDTNTDHRLILKIASDAGDKMWEGQIIGKWATQSIHENPTANETHNFTMTILVEKPVTDARVLFQGSSANMPLMVIDNFKIDAEYKWYHIHPNPAE